MRLQTHQSTPEPGRWRTARGATLVVLSLVTMLAAAAQAAPQGDPAARARELFISALRLVEQQRFAEAAEIGEQARKLDPDNADGLNLLGQVYEQLQRDDDAEQAYLQAMRSDPGWSPPFLNLGTLYLRQSKYSAALTPLQQATELDPNDPRSQALLGVALRNTNQPAEATTAFEHAWRLDPGSGKLAVDVAHARLAEGNLDGAVEAADKAVELLPDDPMPLTVLGQLLVSSTDVNQLTRAPAVFRRAIALAPDSAILWEGLATAYNELALRSDAEAAYRKSLELGNDTPELHFRLGRTLAHQSKWEAALEQYDAVLRQRPDSATALQYRGEALFNLDRSDEALDSFQRAMGISPGQVGPVLSAVQILFVRGDLEQVQEYLGRAAPVNAAEQARVDLETARLRSRQGRSEEALAALNRLLSVDPGNVDGLYLKGQSLIKLGRVEEGRAVLREYQTRFTAERGQEVEALRIGLIGRAQIYSLRGRVYMNEGRYDDALEQLKAATDLAPDNAEVWSLLARLYDLRGDAEAAAAARARLTELQ